MEFYNLCIFMAMGQIRTERLKPFLESVPPGFLTDTAWLRRSGIDSKSIHRYVERGWLEKIVHGVYRRSLGELGAVSPDAVDWQIPVLSLQNIMGCDVHLGGMSALGLHGHTHYLSLGGDARVYLYGEVPKWLARLPSRTQFVVRSRVLFGGDPVGIENEDFEIKGGTGKASLSPWRWPIIVSSPERAVLEALDEVPDGVSFHALDMVFQGLVNLRPKRLMALLAACRSVKVKRLFFVFADRHAHSWVSALDKNAVNLGAGPRALVKGGRLHPVYRIYVPEEFVPGRGSVSDA